MEQEVLDNFQKLQLTKEEAYDIVITNVVRAELLEECSLSLFGRLLTNRQQNQRAFKNTLKAWKMGCVSMLVSKIKPCMCKYELIQTMKLRMAH